jgi:hypothetical protein
MRHEGYRRPNIQGMRWMLDAGSVSCFFFCKFFKLLVYVACFFFVGKIYIKKIRTPRIDAL